MYRMSLDNVIQCQINIDCSPAFRKSLSAILFYCFSDLSWKESIDFPNLVNTSCNIRNINISKLFDLFLTFFQHHSKIFHGFPKFFRRCFSFMFHCNSAAKCSTDSICIIKNGCIDPGCSDIGSRETDPRLQIRDISTCIIEF